MDGRTSEANTKAKTAAVLGFANIPRPYPPAVQPIASMARSGSDEVRRAAIKALENMKDPAGFDALIRALDDKLPALQVMAAVERQGFLNLSFVADPPRGER